MRSNPINRPLRFPALAFAIATLALALLSAGSAHAATYSWKGASNGNLTGTAANWSPGTVPGQLDVAEWNAASYTNPPTANASMSVGELWFAAGNTAGVAFGTAL